MKPVLYSHTHLQAAQIHAQSKACKRVCLFLPTDGKENNEMPTHGIVHAGFSGLRAFVARKRSRGVNDSKSPRIPARHHTMGTL